MRTCRGRPSPRGIRRSRRGCGRHEGGRRRGRRAGSFGSVECVVNGEDVARGELVLPFDDHALGDVGLKVGPGKLPPMVHMRVGAGRGGPSRSSRGWACGSRGAGLWRSSDWGGFRRAERWRGWAADLRRVRASKDRVREPGIGVQARMEGEASGGQAPGGDKRSARDQRGISKGKG